MKPIISVVAGTEHTICLSGNGAVYSWGSNKFGQLGLKHFQNASTPQLINFNKRKVVQIASGDTRSYALLENGVIYSWGIPDRVRRVFENSKNIFQTYNSLCRKFMIHRSLRLNSQCHGRSKHRQV